MLRVSSRQAVGQRLWQLYRCANKFRGTLALVLLLAAPLAYGQLDAIRSEFSAALRDAQATQKQGPALIALLDEASLQIPANYVFVPTPAAGRLLKAMGNTVDPHLVGVVFPGHEENWLMVVQFEKTGFIKEDDARDWNVDELLRSVREGTERGNLQRHAQGLPEIEVTGWAEKPRYDANSHRLVWAVAAHDRGPGGDKTGDQGVNYNTYVLGRDGYFKFNLVTDLKDLAAQQAAADAVIASLSYIDGKRYADFDASSDPVADFSITALVAGIAVKKLGWPAVLAATVAKFSIAIFAAALVVLVGLLGYLLVKRRGRNRSKADDFPPTEIAAHAIDAPTLARSDQPTVVMPVDASDTSDWSDNDQPGPVPDQANEPSNAAEPKEVAAPHDVAEPQSDVPAKAPEPPVH